MTVTPHEILERHNLGHLVYARPEVLRAEMCKLAEKVLLLGSPCGSNEVELAYGAVILSALNLAFLGFGDEGVPNENDDKGDPTEP